MVLECCAVANSRADAICRECRSGTLILVRRVADNERGGSRGGGSRRGGSRRGGSRGGRHYATGGMEDWNGNVCVIRGRQTSDFEQAYSHNLWCQ